MDNPSVFQLLGNKRLEQLDGLRGICALVVLINHLVYEAFWATNNIEFYPPLFLRSIASFGHIAVMIFFVLSGFVIGYTTPYKFTLKEAQNYVIRRIIRLYPIYVFAIFITFAFAETPYSILDIIGHLLFMQGWLVPVIKNNLPLWSLHYEFIFYLLYLFIWRFNLKIRQLILVCIVSGIFSAIFRFHPFEILGYFTFWLSGLWLSKNLTSLKLISQNYLSYRFWTPCILMGAFASQNILNMAVDKYGTSSTVITDILLVAMISSVVASLIVEYKIYWYNLTFTIVLLIEIITIIYSLQQHTFFSTNGLMFGYQSVAFFLLLLPLSFLLKTIPILLLEKIRKISYFSYALYIIHSPIICAVYHFLPVDNLAKILSNSLIIIIFSILIGWILECYLQVKIAKKLKLTFKLI